MLNAQVYIKQNYPNPEEVKILDVKGKKIDGHLDLSLFTNLEKLDCSCNLLTNLDLSNCPKLNSIDCSYNLLDNLDFLTELPSPEKIIYLNFDDCGAFLSQEETTQTFLKLFANLRNQGKFKEEVQQTGELQNNRTKVIDLEKQCDLLQKQLIKSQAEAQFQIWQWQRKYETVSQKSQSLTEQLKKNKEETLQAQRQIKQLNQEKTELKVQLTQAKSSIQELKDRQTELLKQKEQLEIQEKQLIRKLEQSQTNYQQINVEKEEKKSFLEVLKQSQAITLQQMQDKSKREAELEQEISQLEEKLNQEEENKKQLAEALQTKEVKIKTLEKQLSELEDERITQLKAKESELDKIKGELEKKIRYGKDSTAHIRKELILKQKELSETKEELTEISAAKEQEVIKKATAFLNAKKLFINQRQGTIQKLENCYNEFENSGRQLTKFTMVGNVLSNSGGVANTLTGGIAGTPIKLLGSGITAGVNVFKGRSWSKCLKEFKKILVEDEESLPLFDENYQLLVNLVWSENIKKEVALAVIEPLKLAKNKPSPFSNQHSVFGVSGIWKGKSLDFGEMKDIIISLNKNLTKFKQELQQEENQYQEKIKQFFGKEFIIELAANNLSSEQLQAQIIQPTLSGQK